MYFYGVIGIIALLIAFVIYKEIQKNKQYNLERQRRLEKKTDTKVTEDTETTQQNIIQPQPTIQTIQEKNDEESQAEEVLQPQIDKEELSLPNCDYPVFSYSRLLDMGLSQEDANDFVLDLIKQVEDTLPQIEEAISKNDITHLEELTHSIKGSSTNIGTGGIADLLIDFNTYTKSNSDTVILKHYQKYLMIYLQDLKEKYL